MSSNQVSYIEQDNVAYQGPNELPSYDELAARNGPNSRFGRWRGWIEKRAAERYADLTPDQLQRRRARGWELDSDRQSPAPSSSNSSPPTTNPSSSSTFIAAPSLHIQTSNLSLGTDESTLVPTTATSTAPLPFGTGKLSPSQLRICQFGSRFLPHATSQIRCLLPLMGDRYLLIGHDEGLSVLDMFPKEWVESGDLINKGPTEAIARQIWIGESVLQMTLLEMEHAGDGTPAGVVLALVGPEQGESECPRTLRMYNLSSLINLIKWAISTKGTNPLDLYNKNHNGNLYALHTSPKKHRSQHSIGRGLMQLREQTSTSSSIPSMDAHSLAEKPLPPISESPTFRKRSPSPTALTITGSDSDSSWEILDFEGHPQRWASDYVPLATPGSRLVGMNVQSYAFWYDENRKGKGGQLLAVVTKNNILLYETPKGERAFRFVKEFYTPLHPRGANFFHQNVVMPQEYNRHKRSNSTATIRPNSHKGNNSGSSSLLHDYGTHLSLFVVFDKKAGWIRIADSAVGEMEISDNFNGASSSSHSLGKDTISSPTNTVRRIRHSFIELHSLNKWGPPITKCDLSFEPGISILPSQVHLVTRGKETQVVPCPLPANFSTPLWRVRWRTAPSHVLGRLYSLESEDGAPPFLQIIALGDDGIEVQEIVIYHFTQEKGKGKARVTRPSRTHEDLGGPVGFLCGGGHWNSYEDMCTRNGVMRSSSGSSFFSLDSSSSSSTYDTDKKLKRQQGVYAWWCKDFQDWRIFWIGGTSVDLDDDEMDAASI